MNGDWLIVLLFLGGWAGVTGWTFFSLTWDDPEYGGEKVCVILGTFGSFLFAITALSWYFDLIG